MEKTLGLVRGRHNMPVDAYIFEYEINPLDVNGLMQQAYTRLLAEFPKYEVTVASLYNQSDYTDIPIEYRGKLNLYVTGLTVALVATLNAAVQLGIDVVLYHYNNETGEYYPQPVANYQR